MTTRTAARDLRWRLANTDPGDRFTVLGACPEGGCTTHARLDDVDRSSRLDVFCVAHRRRLLFGLLRAREDPKIACGPRCREAFALFCKCSCAGANHGRDR